MSTSDPGTDFMSRGFQGYTRAEMTATTALTSREDPRWRWVLPVTRTTRNYITAQIPALQLSYAMAVALIYAAAQAEDALSPSLMAWWLAEAAASLGAIVDLSTAIARLARKSRAGQCYGCCLSSR
jgi:hypothetical protein